jgi:hypothetical protein
VEEEKGKGSGKKKTRQDTSPRPAPSFEDALSWRPTLDNPVEPKRANDPGLARRCVTNEDDNAYLSMVGSVSQDVVCLGQSFDQFRTRMRVGRGRGRSQGWGRTKKGLDWGGTGARLCSLLSTMTRQERVRPGGRRSKSNKGITFQETQDLVFVAAVTDSCQRPKNCELTYLINIGCDLRDCQPCRLPILWLWLRSFGQQQGWRREKACRPTSTARARELAPSLNSHDEWPGSLM